MGRSRTETRPRNLTRDSGRATWLEVGVVVLLLLPSLLGSFLVAGPPTASFATTAMVVIARDAGLVALILFLAWKNREPPSTLGWSAQRFAREVVIGLALFPALLFGAGLLEAGLELLGLPATRAAPIPTISGSRSDAIVAVVLVVVVAISEEALFRGYLIRRIRQLGAGRFVAIVVSSVLFALGHGYEGAAGVVTIAAVGAGFALVYSWRGTLVAPVVMHACQDLVAILVAPELGIGRG